MRTRFTVLLCLASISAIFVDAQRMPSYFDVVQHFAKHYDPESDHFVNLTFAKKPEGWYVQVLTNEDLAQDHTREYSNQYLYWSKSAGDYVPLESIDNRPSSDKYAAQLWRNALNYWYDMNRNLYFGYNGWDVDVIKALEGKNSIDDTLRESLARAYSNYAHRYLWYQSGGAPQNKDPLQQKRAPLAPVPEAAADSAAAYIRKSADQYRIIASRDRWYPTIVGSAALKQNNQLLFGWQVMTLSGYPKKAAAFFQDVHLDTAQIRMARKLLDECPQDAILVTYGDNDTYQPCYVQDALGYRKDVTVVNISLLGVPEYAEWLKNTGKLDFTLTRKTFADRGISYVLFNTSANKSDPKSKVVKSVAQLLDEISNAEQNADANGYYRVDSLFIPVNVHAPIWGSIAYPREEAISPALRRYYLLSDLLLLDVINSNISKRPIFLTAQEDGLLLPYELDYGMVFELTPANEPWRAITSWISRMESIAAHELDFMPTYNGADNQAHGNLMKLLNNRFVLANYYDSVGSIQKRNQHLDAATTLLQQNKACSGEGLFTTGCNLIKYKYHLELGQTLVEDYLRHLVANSKSYTNALLPPDEDDGDRYYSTARSLFEERGLSTRRIDSIWKLRSTK